MRKRKSTAVQSYLLASAVIHVGVFLVIWLSQPAKQGAAATSLQIYSISENELAAMGAELPALARTGDPVQSSLELTPDPLQQLPRDRELLPVHEPSPDAVTEARGQIVELADPIRAQEAPEDAHYLTRANHRVDEEMANRRYRVNSEVVAPEFSNEASLEHGKEGTAKARLEGDSLLEQGVEGRPDGEALASLPPRAEEAPPERIPRPGSKPSEATISVPEPAESTVTKEPIEEEGDEVAGNEAAVTPLTESLAMAMVTPNLRASVSSLSSPEQAKAQDGEDEGVSSPLALFPDRLRLGHGGGGGDDGSAPLQLQQGTFQGAPTNDRLLVRKGEATMLNAKEFRYFGYMQLIKRQVDFYWVQALENVGEVHERLTRTEYTSTLNVAIDRKGNLKSASLVRSCGVRSFDEATMQAFRIAAPFPPPPEGLLDASGQAELPAFEFTVQLSRGGPRYSAVDPRSNVLFPGIVWPR